MCSLVIKQCTFSLQSLIEASFTGNVVVVQLALQGGADPNQANEVRIDGITNGISNIKLLPEAGAGLQSVSKRGTTIMTFDLGVSLPLS